MDTLKLNKVVNYLLIIVVIISCYNHENVKNKGQKKCDCKDTIRLNTNVIILKTKQLKSNKKGMKILHIRNGKIIENLKYKFLDFNESWISFSDPKNLFRTDIIKISFKNNSEYILHDFVYNTHFGGRRTVGCRVEYCKINNSDNVYIVENISL